MPRSAPQPLFALLLSRTPSGGRFSAWLCQDEVLPAPVLDIVSADDHHRFSRALRVSDLQQFKDLLDLEPRTPSLVMALVSELLALPALGSCRFASRLQSHEMASPAQRSCFSARVRLRLARANAPSRCITASRNVASVQSVV